MKKLTQKKTAFYILWAAHKVDPEAYIPAWKFVGEIFLKEINRWFFMSYKGPTNGLVIYSENPGLVDRRLTTGKTGAKYFEYRMNPHPTFDMIKDEDLRKFARELEIEYRKTHVVHMEPSKS